VSAHTAYLVGAIFAAGSAFAAWAAVWQVWRIRRLARLPELHGTVSKARGVGYDTLKLTVHNAGGGLAKVVHAAIVGRTHAIDPALTTTGFLAPGESGRVMFQLPSDPPPRVVIVARDVNEFVHAYSDGKPSRVYRQRFRWWRPRYPATSDIFAQYFPDVPDFTESHAATLSATITSDEDEQKFYEGLAAGARGR